MSQSDINIWNYQLPNNGAELISQSLGCSDASELEDIFVAAEGSATSEISVEQTVAETLAAIDALDLPEETKANLKAEINAGDDWDDEDENDAPVAGDGDAFLPSLVATLLAESHMFFDAPYADIPYEDRDTAVLSRFNATADIVSKYLNQEAADLGGAFALSTEALYANDAFIFDSPVGRTLGEHVALWPTADGTWFLGVQHEDKELPIIIVFGHFNSDDHATLGAHLKGFV